MDLEGRVELRGPGLEELKAIPSGAPLLWSAVLPRQPFDMFSDLNQWMLKVLLAPRVPLPLLSAPRASISGAASLAAAAHVSAPSAFRLLRHLAQNKWLEEVAPLRLVRVPELLRRWRAASQRPPHEIRMRWLIPGHPDQLRLALRRYHLKRHRSAEPNALSDSPADALPRACLGLYSAANALGLGHVRGVADYLYVERLAPPVFDALGLSNAEPGDRVDVVVRLPRWPRALFRAAVEQDGVLVSDVIQVWLDVSEHPARGAEQADEILEAGPRGRGGRRGRAMTNEFDNASFVRVASALRSYLDDIVVVGGWAHRLFRLHPLALTVDVPPLMTMDADVAAPNRLRGRGRTLRELLADAGFTEHLSGDDIPPRTEYHFDERSGVYLQFITPLAGDGYRRDGRPNATQLIQGIAAEKLRYIDLLLLAPWTVQLSEAGGYPIGPASVPIRICNPVSYLAQKVLSLPSRRREKRGKDVLYIYDTLLLVWWRA